MNYRNHRNYIISKKWIILTLFLFAISYVVMQVLYTYADKKPDFNMTLLTVSYIVPIILCVISLTFFHFEFLRIGGFVGVLIGINLISNVAFTEIIINSTETLMTLFEPIFSILPLLSESVGIQQFDFIKNIVILLQILYGIFIILINISVILKREKSPVHGL